MDPYIENPNLFSDFHGALAGEIRSALNRVMQPRYVAQIVQRIEYEVIEIGELRSMVPDVEVLHDPQGLASTATATLTTTAPSAESVIETEYATRIFSVEIYQVENLQLVAHIEILSPSNKRLGQQSYQDYISKRPDIFRSSAHFVEIDLLRGGTRPRLERPVPVAPYYVTISRSDKRPRVSVWSIKLQDRLPILPIPLLEPDPDSPLDLGVCVANVYETGRYAIRINYREAPPPPKLSSHEIEYVDSLLIPLRENV
jgi:hypothetical protein